MDSNLSRQPDAPVNKMNTQITEVLTEKSNQTAREIAKQLNQDRHIINKTLYKMVNVVKSEDHIPKWSLKPVETIIETIQEITIPTVTIPETKIETIIETIVEPPPAPVVETKAPLIAPKGGRYIVCLPTYGRPYISHVTNHGSTKKILKEVVQGPVQMLDNKYFVIHPMFCEENRKWSIAQALLQQGNPEVWVNEEGSVTCVPNMGTVLTRRYPGGCPHLFGDVALVVSKSKLEKIVDPMTLQLRPEDDREVNGEEDDDEEDDDE